MKSKYIKLNKRGFSWFQIASAIVIIVAVFVVIAIFSGIMRSSGETFSEKFNDWKEQLLSIDITKPGEMPGIGRGGGSGGDTTSTSTTLTVKSATDWSNLDPEEVKVGTNTFYFKTQKDGNFYISDNKNEKDLSKYIHIKINNENYARCIEVNRKDLCIKVISLVTDQVEIKANDHTPGGALLYYKSGYDGIYWIKKGITYNIVRETAGSMSFTYVGFTTIRQDKIKLETPGIDCRQGIGFGDAQEIHLWVETRIGHEWDDCDAFDNEFHIKWVAQKNNWDIVKIDIDPGPISIFR